MWTQRAREYGPMCLVLLCTGAFLRVETARLAARGDDVNRLQSEVAALDARATRTERRGAEKWAANAWVHLRDFRTPHAKGLTG